MKIKGIIDEDFVNYKKVSMFIALGSCDWKCCVEANIPITVCQNCDLAKSKDIEISYQEIFDRYKQNLISESVVIGGLEPATQKDDIYNLIKLFRDNGCNDTFVIYTGYYPEEIYEWINNLKQFKNIIFKFGRYKPNNNKHYDNVLGIYLISDNQYGLEIS